MASSVDAQDERRRLGEVFSRADARTAGLSNRRLYLLRDQGHVVALGGGVYRWADAAPANFDLIELAERVPRGTLCLETALARHGLLDSIPALIDVAIPRGAHRPRLKAPVRLHTFGSATFDLGRESIDVGARRPLGVYSAERSLVDLIRLRHNEGAELGWEGLRRWLGRAGSSPAQLLALASRFPGAEASLRAALEVLM